MDDLILQFFDDLVAGGVSKYWIYGCLFLAGAGIFLYYFIKTTSYLATYFKKSENVISKEEIDSFKQSLQGDNKALFQILDDVRDRIKNLETSGNHTIELNRQLDNELSKISVMVDTIKDSQASDFKDSTESRRDLTSLVSDSKAQYLEITRQVQALQKDLASLHGTIIGISTQRSRLK